ncbi:glycosyltransferase family 4 protein [Aquimarina hainanensis]|uniref:Glycosyltransferase family 4 protein n=1 Tax=Aquimarina hainanensis TaxID=1578017 RepID=A0ABW5NAH2_9FLAO
MHILHLSAVTNWGGGEKHIETLYNELSELAPEVKNTIFCAKNGDFHKHLKTQQINYITAPLSIKVDPRFFIKLGIICKREKVDLIHIHDPSAILLAILSDKIFNLPPFIYSKKTSFPIKNRKKTLFKYNYPKIKKVICVSNKTKEIAAKSIVDNHKIVTIYDGTDIETPLKKPSFAIREKFNLKEDTVIVGNIANHIRAKHLDTLIDIVDIIINKENKKNFFFIQMGNYTERTEPLLQRAKELQLEQHLVFSGFTPNASSFLPQFDINLITSQSEGMPLVIYESLLHKTAVVSTDVGGIPEIIEHNINGLLSPMHSPDKQAEQIISLSEDDALKEKFIKNGYEKVINNYSSKNMALETLQLYKNIV